MVYRVARNVADPTTIPSRMMWSIRFVYVTEILQNKGDILCRGRSERFCE